MFWDDLLAANTSKELEREEIEESCCRGIAYVCAVRASGARVGNALARPKDSVPCKYVSWKAYAGGP